MIYCIIQGPSDYLTKQLKRFWPPEYIWFKPNGDIIVAVGEIFTDDLGPHKKLYLALGVDAFRCNYTVNYDEFNNYIRSRTL